MECKHHHLSVEWRPRVSQRQQILFWLAIACAVYIPIGIYLFDISLSTMLERAYFTIGGGAIALYAQS